MIIFEETEADLRTLSSITNAHNSIVESEGRKRIWETRMLTAMELSRYNGRYFEEWCNTYTSIAEEFEIPNNIVSAYAESVIYGI